MFNVIRECRLPSVGLLFTGAPPKPPRRPGGMRFQSATHGGIAPHPVRSGRQVQDLTPFYSSQFTSDLEHNLWMELHQEFTSPEQHMSETAWQQLCARFNFRIMQHITSGAPGPMPGLKTVRQLKAYARQQADEVQQSVAATYGRIASQPQGAAKLQR